MGSVRSTGSSVAGPVLGVPIAVIYKYVDDQATYLAVIVTYYALFAIFPLLLLATSILGFLLQGDPELQQRVLDSALSQFPVLGDQFRRPEGLTGSTTAVIVGALAATYGAMGLGTAVQNATSIAWSVPRNSRLNPILLRVRGLLIVAFGGLAVLALTTLSVLISNTTLITWFEASPLRLARPRGERAGHRRPAVGADAPGGGAPGAAAHHAARGHVHRGDVAPAPAGGCDLRDARARGCERRQRDVRGWCSA